jgi:hypothetical protein
VLSEGTTGLLGCGAPRARFLIAGNDFVTGKVFAAGTAPLAGNFRDRCGAVVGPATLPPCDGRAAPPNVAGFAGARGALGK